MNTNLIINLALATCCFGGNLVPAPQEITVPKTASKQSLTVHSNTIAYNNAESEKAAKILAHDLERMFGKEFSVAKSESLQEGCINVFLMPWKEAGSSYRLQIGDEVMLGATTLDGLLAGSASMLQLAAKAERGLSFPKTQISDAPDKEFRAVMIDIKNHWHPVSELKKMIDLARFYKINYLSLHTGEGQWIGALTEQMAKMPESDRISHKFYTKEEMEEVIAYGGARGVYLLPHNESTPHFGHMVNAMKKDYVPGDEFDGFADELAGGGEFDFSGKANERWYKVMEIATSKAIDQFAAAHSDGVLPYYHIGPVLGEGGMSPEIAARIVEMIIIKSPKTKVMFWNGISAKNKSLEKYKENIVIAYYDDEFGKSDMNAYLEEGWLVANAAWSPLYIVGSKLARPVENVYKDWNMMRQGSDGIPGGYSAVTWEQPDQQYAKQVIGGLLATWETPTKFHFARLQRRVPAFAEHAWKVSDWPYPEANYTDFQKRYRGAAKAFAKYTGQLDENPSAPSLVEASDGSAKSRVVLEWRSSGFDQRYDILRSTDKDEATAVKIGSTTEFVQEYSDTDVEIGTKYYYWIKAINSKGESPLSQRVIGMPGTGIADVRSYEAFDYKKDAKLVGANGGDGWKGAWEVRCDGESELSLDSEGLTYGDLPVSGGSFRVKIADDKKSAQVKRSLSGTLGMDETTVWISWLFKANAVGNGDAFIAPNGHSVAAVGKNWGNQFSVYMNQTGTRIQPGKTYFLVAKYEFGASGDTATLWIDPSLDKEPEAATASGTGTVDAKMGNEIAFNLQGHGRGDYHFDEIRLGESWGDVGGQINKNDKTPPEPDVMTWINPPSIMDDGSVFMQVAEASDESGVEYYFVCSDPKFSSSWQTNGSYAAKPSPGTYQFRVRARDKSANKNENQWSFVAEVVVPQP